MRGSIGHPAHSSTFRPGHFLMNHSIDAAILNIATFGDTDIFPYSFEQHIFHDRPELLRAALQHLHKDFDTQLARHPPYNINTLAPVGYTAFRWATQLDPLWNAYYLALVIEMGDAIEQGRISTAERCIFSYRFIPPAPDGRIFDDAISWREFMTVSCEAANEFPFVIICDISDFYSRIYHHRVENALKWLRTNPEITKRISTLLQVFSGTVSYGIPVGGPASRLLAELALNGVDKLLRAEGIRFCRFVDDYRIFCSSQDEAYRRLIFLSDKLFNEGLALQKNKTRILTAKEFRDEVGLLLKAHQADEDNLTDEDRLLRLTLHFDPYSDTRVDDYEELKTQVSQIDIAAILARELDKTRIDPSIVRRALSALRLVEPELRKGILASLLHEVNINTMAPVFPRLMMVLRGLYPDLDDGSKTLVDKALIQLVDNNSHIVSVDLNLAYLVQVLRLQSTQQKESLFVKLFKERTSPLVRREIILAMAAWGHTHWLSDLKRSFNALSSWERRCFLLASYVLSDEGRHWRDHNNSAFDPGEVLVRDWFSVRWQKNPTIP